MSFARKKINRRRLFAATGAGVFCCALGGGYYYCRERSPASLGMMQIVGADLSDARSFIWNGNEGERLKLRLSGSSRRTVRTFDAVTRSVSLRGKAYDYQTVQISGLQSDTLYEYRIENRNRTATKWVTFRTPGERECSALIFADSHSGDHYKEWGKLYQAALARFPDMDFTAHLGNIVDSGSEVKQWHEWIGAGANNFARIPLALVMGDHETEDGAAAYLQSPIPENGSQRFRRWYYAFDSGPVRFVILNTNWNSLADGKRDELLKEMKGWFRMIGSRSGRQWLVVMMHADPFHYGLKKNPDKTKKDFSETGEELMPLFDETGVDLVLSAGLHSYRNRGHVKNFKRSETGPVYICCGVSGSIRCPACLIGNTFDMVVPPQPEGTNYLAFEATDKMLSVKNISSTAIIMDRIVLSKKNQAPA